jgi:hypothetical protein
LPLSITSRIKPIIFTYLHPRAFIFYIEQLETLDVKNKAQYHDFALKCLKDFIENNIGWIRDDYSGHAQELLDFDPKLGEYYKQCTATNQQNSINSSEKIIGLMRDVIENGKRLHISSTIRWHDYPSKSQKSL